MVQKILIFLEGGAGGGGGMEKERREGEASRDDINLLL